MAAHKYIRPQGRVMDRATVDSAIGDGFFNASLGFRQIIHTSHAEILSANNR